MTDWGPCQSWPTICDDFPDTTDPQVIADATDIATEILWNRTKQQFGLCEITLRPCKKECLPTSPWLPSIGSADASGWGYPFPVLSGGQWVNLGCGGCKSGCSCTVLEEARLPYPVASIVEVKVDGVVLDPTAYRVDDWHLLVRVDGGSWPSCNDLTQEDTEEGTWSVTAEYGKPVPKLGQLAAGQLATEIVKYCNQDVSCKLPTGTVQQINRQGVTKTFFDADEAFKGGKTGLYYPDLFIHTYNPSGTGIATIYNIDNPPTRRTGTA